MAYVEARAFEPLAFADLAAVAGLSPYHFARQFSARYGLTPMAFVRARRLGLAAKLLASPHPPALIDLAFDTGFEFAGRFHPRVQARLRGQPRPLPPRRAAPTPTEILAMSDIAAVARVTHDPAPLNKPGFRVAGVSAVFDESNEAGIPLLWQRLVPRLPLPGQVGDGTYGVGCPTDSGDGCFRYMPASPSRRTLPSPTGSRRSMSRPRPTSSSASTPTGRPCTPRCKPRTGKSGAIGCRSRAASSPTVPTSRSTRRASSPIGRRALSGGSRSMPARPWPRTRARSASSISRKRA